MNWRLCLIISLVSYNYSALATESANTTMNGTINFADDISADVGNFNIGNVLNDEAINLDSATNITKDPDLTIICSLSGADLSGTTLTLENNNSDQFTLNLILDNTNICDNISLSGIIDSNAELGTSYGISGVITMSISYQ